MAIKTLNMYMIDASTTGRIKYSFPFWTGLVFKIPRTMVKDCTDRAEYKYAGIYFLFGNDEDSGKPMVYIGQAVHRKNGEGLINRLKEHMKDPSKDFWNEAVIVTTVNDILGPTEISYLEHQFCDIAIKANRYIVKNGNDPNIGNPSEETEDALIDFIEYTKLAIGQTGHRFFEPLVSQNSASSDGVILNFKYSSASGRGMLTADGFVVFKGAKLRLDPVNTCPSSCINNREKYKNIISEDGTLLEDALFNSPSGAGCFLAASHLSGNEYWKDDNGVSLKNLGL